MISDSTRTTVRTVVAALGIAFVAAAADVTAADAQQTAPPGGEFQKVSQLVELPEFVPGLGILYVNPETLPAGPFLAYDRSDRLVSTIYMLPLDALNQQEAFTGLDAAGAEVDHVDVRYNPGHPGLSEPHYHVVLWHVSEEKAAALSE